MSVLEDCRVPVLIGVHGMCVGGGIDLISAADLRYCTTDAKFSIKEIDIGVAADIGTL
jgi:enoyl-CoA hydratase/carnithine racemase